MDDLNTSYLTAVSALAGALIGGLTSLATSWLTQRAQLRHALLQADRATLQTLYSDFITEAASLLGDALTHQKDTDAVKDIVHLFAMVGRMRLVSTREVVDAATRVEDAIIETYLGPNRTLREMLDYSHQGGTSFLTEFGEACRKHLEMLSMAVR